jgi:hypothetical protein
MREYVADHGQPIDRGDIEHVTIASRSVAVSTELTESEREFIGDAIRATGPVAQACFHNSIELWEYDRRFKFTEGFAAHDEFDIGGFEHAWCMLDGGKLVDVTTTFDDYYGVVIGDDTIRHYTSDENRSYGVIGNHRNRFRLLREQGYMEEDAKGQN